MGNKASSSSKMTNTQQAYVSAVQNTTNNSIAAAYNSTVISVRDVSGDVNLGNIDVNQVASATATAQFSNTNDSSILQKVSASLDNQAESLVKGIGLGNSSRSTAVVNNYINSTMELSQQITNNCSANATNVFAIDVQKVGGNVNVKDITVTQGADAMLQCMAQNEQKIAATQENTAEITQKTKSSSTGITGLGFGMIMIVFIVLAVLFLGGIGAVGKMVFGKLTDPKLIGIVVGASILMSGVGTLIKYTQIQVTYEPGDCSAVQTELDKMTKIKEARQGKSVVIKPFFFTCGIYGKGTNCERLFDPPKISGAFTPTPRPAINMNATGGVNACTFAIHDLTQTTFTDVSDAYTAFRYTDDCKALDVLYSLDGRIQYVFYKSVSPMCYHALYADLNQNIALWDGKTDWTTIQRNPLFPPMTCTVLPVIEGAPNNTDTLNRPFYIRISRNGYVYYFKDNAWMQVNPTNFWTATGKTAPPLTNILVYRGSPDKTPDLLSPDKNPRVVPNQSVAYIDINAVANGSYFDLYWKDLASYTATDAMQGFTKIGTIDCSVMSNDKVVPYGPNPLLQFMNRTWVKFNEIDDAIMTDEEKATFTSEFDHPSQAAYYKALQDKLTECNNANIPKDNEHKKNVTIKKTILIIGVVLILVGVIICGIAAIMSRSPPPPAQKPASGVGSDGLSTINSAKSPL